MGNSDNTYDGIILGAGHNGLILQAYLAKAGFKTLSLERRHSVGGGLCTMEDPRYPGFYHNTHAFFQRAITDMPWYADLELQNQGLEYIEPELNVSMLTRDGHSLEWWTDIERTIESFSAFDKADADTLTRWHEEFAPIVKDILSREALSPPLPPEKRRAILQKTRMGRRLLEVSELSPLEFVHKEFRNPAIKAGLLFFNGLREVDPRVRGFGHHIPALLASPRKAQMSRGGSASLAKALQSAVLKAGGEIRTMVSPARILVEKGKAIGVRTENGEVIHAKKFVISSLNPHQTFIDLLNKTDISLSIRSKAQKFQYNLIAPLFGLNLNLREAPSYKAAEKYPQLKKAFMVIMGLDHIDQYSEIIRHHECGTIPPTVMWGACPTLFDPSQAPAGMHTAFMWEKLPYKLHGNASNWDSEREKHGKAMLKVWEKYAPNLKDSVLGSFTRSPLDIERCLANMKNGDLLVGAFTNGQIGYNRPFPGAGHYRAGIKGLYLCGSSSHPGGNITGLPAYNAAQVVLADAKIPLHRVFSRIDVDHRRS